MGEELIVGAEYGWVLFVATLIAFQVWFQGMGINSVRKQLFTKEFFQKKFPDMKEKDYPEGGYPDMGCGIYAQKLSTKDWIKFNNYQRSHYNYVESIATILTFLLVSGLFFPNFATVAGVVYFIGRAFYASGYRRGGSRGRLFGVLLVDLALISLFIASLYGTWTFAGGWKTLQTVPLKFIESASKLF